MNSPSLSNPFQVDFIWLGTGIPGAQQFDLYDSTFATIASGGTSPSGGGGNTVPDQGGWLLPLLGFGTVMILKQVVLRSGKSAKSQSNGL